MTVSNAFNRPDQLSEATRRRVLDAARRVGYPGPDPTAASLRRGRTHAVGVVLRNELRHAFGDPGIMEILSGLATQLGREGLSVLILPDPGTAETVEDSRVNHVMVDAFVLWSLSSDSAAVGAAWNRRLPVVTIGSALPGVPYVGVDNYVSAATAADYLISLGHRRLAALTAGHSPESAERRPEFTERAEGFHKAVAGKQSAGVTLCIANGYGRAGAAGAVAEMLTMPAATRPTALFAVTDVLALGAIDAARDYGLDVPGEFSVIGCDDIWEAAISNPPLTTLHQDLFGHGRIAALLVAQQLEGEPACDTRTTAKLVVRDSCAPPRLSNGGGTSERED